MSEKNLFLMLSKYVRRQNENLLTQSLAALFNNCDVFRYDLVDLLGRRSEGRRLKTAGAPCAATQRAHILRSGRILVDLEIGWGEDQSPQYIVEAKLTALLSPKQARNYSELLKRWRGQSRLVLITKAVVDTELKKLLPKNTLWLTWTEIAELALRRAHNKSKTERFLCRQFHEMLKERGVPMVPSITSGEYKNLAVLNWFIEPRSRTDLTKDHIDTINNVMARMEEFTGHNWGGLTDYGYKPFTRLYAHRPSKNNGGEHPYVEILVGFYLWQQGEHITERYIYLALDCRKMRLSVLGGWKLRNGHSKYRIYQDEDRPLKTWTPDDSSAFFKEHLSDAQKKIQPQLKKCLSQFRKSRYYNA